MESLLCICNLQTPQVSVALYLFGFILSIAVLSATVCFGAGDVPVQRLLLIASSTSGYMQCNSLESSSNVERIQSDYEECEQELQRTVTVVKKEGQRALFQMVRLLVALVGLQLKRNEEYVSICFGTLLWDG
ncbi:uncharacterized protein MONOS_18164 [Monocercomonoides exilis]|uniref:uncharacterized protein n=1 Tax=Monocercomonoides exilis TaxID=2049356 RepID=UPI003559FE36|nr:hypothetical protein MONOS_18164 [Monocercomonoides exilis]